MKKIYTIRHAKTERHNTHDDHERQLTKEGQQDSRKLSHYIQANPITPDYIICSDATRTKQTLQPVKQALSADIPIQFSSRLYLASGNELLRFIHEIPEQYHTILLVGHNPGISELLQRLPNDRAEISIFPTSGLALYHYEHATHWQQIEPYKAEFSLLFMP